MKLREHVFDGGRLRVTGFFAWLDSDSEPWYLYYCHPADELGAYVTYEPLEGGRRRHIVALNLCALRELIEKGADARELATVIAASILHELTHYAMTREELEHWERKGGSRITHSLLWNPILQKIVEETISSHY